MTRRNIRKYIGAFLVALVATSCTENNMEEYENDPAIYFLNGSVYNDDGTVSSGKLQKDSVNQSFFVYDSDKMRDTVYVFVKTMGKVSSTDRPIALVQTNTGDDAAVPGTHYVPLDDPEVTKHMYVPAGKVYAKIPIILLRDKSLQTSQKRLELEVAKNECFRPGIDAWRKFVITTTDLAVKPAMWDSRWRYYFGPTFGSVKLKFIINATGYTDFDNLPSDYSYITWLKTTVQQAFFDYNKAHPDDPLKEADGTLVTFD